MKSLVVEDDFTSRLLIQRLLMKYGECHMAVNGREALSAYESAIQAGEPYDLICLDIIMPEMDGQQTLKEIRAMEESKGILIGDGVRIIMITALGDISNKINALHGFCDAYLVKPIDGNDLLDSLRGFKLID